MFCRNCGKQLEDNDKFCSGCGSNTGVENFVQQPIQQQTPIYQQVQQPIQHQPVNNQASILNSFNGKSINFFISIGISAALLFLMFQEWLKAP